jgi:hypothetical protein
MGEIEIGDIVEVKATGHAEQDLMYRGWRGVIVAKEGEHLMVDSDAFVRRTGQMQAVSFRAWFPATGLAKQ